jgi:hypothetical protein
MRPVRDFDAFLRMLTEAEERAPSSDTAAEPIAVR